MSGAPDLRAYGPPLRLVDERAPAAVTVIDGGWVLSGYHTLHVTRWAEADVAVVRRGGGEAYRETDAPDAPTRLVLGVEESTRVAADATPACATCHARPAGWLFARRLPPHRTICETCAAREAAPTITGPAVATWPTLSAALAAIEAGALAGTEDAPRVLAVSRARLFRETLLGRTLAETYAALAPRLARRGIALAVDAAAAPEAPVIASAGGWGRVRDWWGRW